MDRVYHSVQPVTSQGDIAKPRRGLSRWLPRRIPIVYKLALSIGTLISLGMMLLGTLIIYNQTQLLQHQIKDFGTTIVGQMAASARDALLANDTLALEVLATSLASSQQVLGTGLFANTGELVAHAGINPFMSGAPFAEHSARYLDKDAHILEWRWHDAQAEPLNAVTFISPVMFKGVVAGHALITLSHQQLDEASRDATRMIVAATVLLIVIGTLLSVWLGRRLSRPIYRLMDASRAIDEGRYHYRIQERRNDEIGQLMVSFNTMADGLLRKTQVENAFSRFMSPTVAREVLSNLETVELSSKKVIASALFADIVGFTTISENLEPHAVASMLNEYFNYFSRGAEHYHGHIDKFMGDCAMVLFGVPDPDEDHCFHAIACALLFQRVIQRVNQSRAERGLFPVQFRIGLNCGDMVAGNIGSHERMEYTVIGDSVNLASRLCSIAEGGQIVISSEVYQMAGVEERVVVRPHQSIQVRGKRKPITTYLVDGLVPEYDEQLERQLEAMFSVYA
jgi:adenylate cyclase